MEENLRARKQLVCRASGLALDAKPLVAKGLRHWTSSVLQARYGSDLCCWSQNSTLAVNVAGDPVELCSTDAVSL